MTDGIVAAVSRSPVHAFGKERRESIRLLAGLGMEGDAHMGVTVKHRSRAARDPSQPNLRQLHLGASALVEVTGLRNPCLQLNGYQPGLMAAVLDRDGRGNLIRKAGVMAIVLAGGELRPGDAIRMEPPPPHRPLAPVRSGVGPCVRPWP